MQDNNGFPWCTTRQISIIYFKSLLISAHIVGLYSKMSSVKRNRAQFLRTTTRSCRCSTRRKTVRMPTWPDLIWVIIMKFKYKRSTCERQSVVASRWGMGTFAPSQGLLPPLSPRWMKKWQKSVIFGNFLDFCPLRNTFCPLDPPPQKIKSGAATEDNHGLIKYYKLNK